MKSSSIFALLFAAIMFSLSESQAAGDSGGVNAPVLNAATTPSVRVLRFPSDHSMGQIMVDEPTSTGKLVWRTLGEARGDVRIPPDSQMPCLVLDRKAATDLSPLLSVGSSGLYKILCLDVPVPAAELKYLAGIESLRGLDLSGSNITNDALQYISRLRSLTDLDLSRNSAITDAGLVHLEPMQELRKLNLSYTGITDAGFAHVAQLRGLRQLRLFDSNISDAGLGYISTLPLLENLSVGSTNDTVTDKGVARLSGIAGLRHLSISSLSITDATFQNLAGLNNLEHLGIWGRLSGPGLAYLGQMRSLRELQLGSLRLSNADLPSFSNLKNLQFLRVTADSISRESLRALVQAPSLRELDLSGSRVPDEDIKWLRTICLSKECKIIGSLGHLRDSKRIR